MYKSPYFSRTENVDMLALFKSVFENSNDGIYVCNKEGRALLFNNALLDISKVQVKEFYDYTVNQLVRNDIIPKSCAGITLQTGKKETTIIDYYRGKKAILTSTPAFDNNNNIKYVISNVRSIKQLNQLNSENNVFLNKMKADSLTGVEDIYQENGLVYSSDEMWEVVSFANRFANNDSSILILGETGVGKDVLAKYIHKKSGREGQFVRVNCGAIPESLIEAELFGFEKGAFTGAGNSKKGLFELADKGTIFLDEIGEMPYHQQAKLLNVLQEKQIRRIGSTKSKHVDVRVIAATNADLSRRMAENKFRSDLYYRLNVLSVTIPPLRERVRDIYAYIYHFLEELEEKYGASKRMDLKAIDTMMSYSWPGNVRELKSTVERLYHLSYTDVITADILPHGLKVPGGSGQLGEHQLTESFIPMPLRDAVFEFEKKLIKKAISENKSLKQAAEQLGIDVSTLVRKKKKMKLY